MFLESDCGRAMIDLCSKMCFALLVFRYVAGLARMHLVYQENPSFLLSEPGERRGELTPSSFARIARIRSALAHEGWLAPPTVRPASRFPLRSGSEMPTRRHGHRCWRVWSSWPTPSGFLTPIVAAGRGSYGVYQSRAEFSGWRFVCGFRAKAESRKATRSPATTA